jgi:hypothetical protein
MLTTPIDPPHKCLAIIEASTQPKDELTAHHKTSQLIRDRAQQESQTSLHDHSDAVTPPNQEYSS